MTQTLLKLAADFASSLRYAVSEGETTATLTSVTDEDDVALANGTYGFTIDGDTEDKEYIVCTIVGTAVTGVVSISRQGAVTSGFSLYHRPSATVEITDWAALYRINSVLNGTTNFDAGTHLGYDAAPAGLTGNEFATVAYVLSVVAGGTVAFDQQVLSNQTFGEICAVNDIVYFKESDARWYKADADLTTTFDRFKLGISKSVGSVGGTGTVSISGPVSGFSGLTPGSKYYLSNTSGAISTTPGTFSVFLGWALSATSFLLSFTPETGALQGSNGVPSSANPFVTQRRTPTDSDQTQTTQNSTSAVGTANTTGLRNKVAQSFIPVELTVRGVELYKSADTGSFTGTVTVAIQADSAGSPSGSDLATVTTTNAGWLLVPTGAFQVGFSSDLSLDPGSLYWIVVSTSTSDSSNHPNVGINTAGGYTSGSVKYNNTTDGWVAVATIDLYFKTLSGFTSKIVSVASDKTIPVVSSGGGLIDFFATDVATSGTSETLVYTKLIPQGVFNLNSGIKIKGGFAGIRDSTGAGGYPVLKIKLNGTTVITLDIGQTDVTGGMGVIFDAVIVNSASLSSQKFGATYVGANGGNNAAVTGIAIAGNSQNGTSSVDTSGAVVLTMSLQQNVGGTSTFKHVLVEKIG